MFQKRTEHMLSQMGIHVEAMGGDTQSVNISALRGTNVDTLTEAIALQAELIGLQGDPTGLVEAVVIECSTSIHRGKLVTALIQRGTLRKGACLGKRSVFDFEHFEDALEGKTHVSEKKNVYEN